jgi:GMP synthase-like glutamine amidotransferase
MTTDVLSKDNTATFAVARLISQFYGIFSKKNINRIIKNELRPNDLSLKKIEWYMLWNNDSYLDWLDIISSPEVIQYDEFEDSIVYFVELKITDLTALNNILGKFDIEFRYFSEEEVENESFIDSGTCHLLKIIRYQTLILETLKAFREENVNYYYILSNKEPFANKRDQVGFYHLPCLLQGLFKRNKEVWTLYSTGTMIFPSHEKLLKTKAIIVPGSHLHANEDYSFLRITEEWLRNFHHNYPSIKLLGICFGLQQTCLSFGGVVKPMRNRKKNSISFISNPEKIKLKEVFWDLDFVKKSGVPKSDDLYLYQSHGDEVTEFPEYFKCLGSSDSCEVEVLVSEDERYFLLQGHPEYDVDFTTSRWCNSCNENEGCYEEMENLFQKKANSKYRSRNEQKEWRSICYSFLKF